MSGTIIRIEDDRTGLEVETLKRAILDNLFCVQGKFPEIATKTDWYMAVAYTVRDRLLERWISSVQTRFRGDGPRVVGYLSAEYLLGPHLVNNIINMGILKNIQEAVIGLGLDFSELVDQEEEPGLGNGGLGRLAACYMDSLSTLEIPAIGYGIRYEFGIFDQAFRDGWQIELTDKWLHFGNPWEIARPEATCTVKFGGYTTSYVDEQGKFRTHWVGDRVINGVPYDTPIPGYKNNTANTLRLWKAEAPETFDFQAFNSGDYLGAVHAKMVSENISKVLYPNDDQVQGRLLRLEQQYFFVSCSLQDVIRLHQREKRDLSTLPEGFALQLNDTHPSIAIAEFMRLMIDEHDVLWDHAWEMCKAIFAYTNHTLLPEALEKWPVDLFDSLLPRHLQIIYEINRRFLEEVRRKFPGDEALAQRLSLIDESGPRYVRMAHLACVGCHSINGVAALHTELLTKDVLADFFKLYPEKFLNVTNGVTPRRWMTISNPRLTDAISEKIGDRWITHLEELSKVEKFVKDKSFREQWIDIKHENKKDLSAVILSKTGILVDPDSMFDVLVKRFHEYKRQHLKALHIVTLYNRLKNNPDLDIVPRTFIFGGKAAPGYFMAKLVIKLINSIGEVVNKDKSIRDRLKIVFLPDYSVGMGQKVYPAADLSEQISTAGKEASGTGNMKFSLNGALTIGTLDGANVEIRECVGAENFFLFGLTANEVYSQKASGYNPYHFYEVEPELKQALDTISQGTFSHGNRDVFAPLINNLLHTDPYMLMADYRSYISCQGEVDKAWNDKDRWATMSILNTARCGKFSSDRAVQEYCDNIWKTHGVPVELVERATEFCAI